MVGYYCCVYAAYIDYLTASYSPEMILSPVTLDPPNVDLPALDCHIFIYYIDISMDSLAYLASEMVAKAIESVCKWEE